MIQNGIYHPRQYVINYKEFLESFNDEDNFSSVGKKILLPFKGKDEEFVVLGLGINPDYNDTYRDYVDIMSTRILIGNVQWNDLDEKDFKLPIYSASRICKTLTNQKYYFSKDIQDHIIPRKIKVFIDDPSHQLSEDKDTFLYENIGDIWIPSLNEIIGYCTVSDDSPNTEQYPYFQDVANRKLDGMWWTRSKRHIEIGK